MAKDSHSVVSDMVESPAPESSSSGAGAPNKPQERIRRIESSLDSVSAIVADKRDDWSAFLAEDNGASAKSAKDQIHALIAIYPK
jgi:hypothetical protein